MKITQQGKAFFVGNTPFAKQPMDVKERIAMKKQLYQKEAMHIVSSAHKAEKKIDRSIEERQEHVQNLQAENDEAHGLLQDLRQRMRDAKEAYNVEDDSQEQKDLELLQKQYDIEKHGTMQLLTPEEQERLENMGELTEYQKLSMELYKQADHWKTKIAKNQEDMALEGRSIRSVKVDRLRSHAIIDAEKAKEEILAAAAKEAAGMLIDDAKDQIDEKAEEIQDAANDRKEEEEEEEARIEAAKEDRTREEALTESIREKIDDLTEQVLDSDETVQNMDDEIKKLMMEEKLLAEDLKGLTMDVAL